MKLIIFFTTVFLFNSSLVYSAESFSFGGIQWTDSRDVINDKLKRTGELEGFRSRSNDTKLSYLGNMYFPLTPKLYKEINNINSKLEACGQKSIVASISDVDTKKLNFDGLLDAGSFGVVCYFSAFDERLVAYIVGIKNDKALAVFQSLQKKYGAGQPLETTGWHLWETSSELLFAPIEGKAEGVLVFVNKDNLQMTLEPCIQKQKAGLEADKAKADKLF